VTRRQSLRDLLVALAVAVGTATGLVTLTPLPWQIALFSATFLATLALLGDILAFDRPVAQRSRIGSPAIATLGALTIVSALAISFFVGREMRSGPTQYPFVVTNSSGVYTVVKSVPYEKAQADRVLATGDRVWVDCVVDQQDGRWYRLTDEQGWLREDELIPSPHSGKGSPPRCPD
jgi:peptidoglycan/LPS O-acetylase OafA/YrhL